MLSKSRNKSQQAFYPIQSSSTLLNHLSLADFVKNRNANMTLKEKRTVSCSELTGPTWTERKPNENISKHSTKRSFNLFKTSQTNFLSPSKTISFKNRSWSSRSSVRSRNRKPQLPNKDIANKLTRKFIQEGQLSFESTFYFKNFNHAKKKIMNDFVEKMNDNNIYSSKRNYQEYLIYLDNNKLAQAKKVESIGREFNKTKEGFEFLGVVNKPFIFPGRKVSIIMKPFSNCALRGNNKHYLKRAYNKRKKINSEMMTNQAANEVMEIECKEYQALNHFTMKTNNETVNMHNLNRQVKLLSILTNHYDYDKDVLLEHDYDKFRNEMNEIDFSRYKALKDLKPRFLKKAFKKQTLIKYKHATGNFFAVPGKPVEIKNMIN